MSRSLAWLILAITLAPTVWAHEEDEPGPRTPTPDDPLAFYRSFPYYSVVDDFWTYGAAEKVLVPAALPTTPYRSQWEFDADGDWVVWVDPTRPGGDVFAFNLDARAGIWLTDDDAEQHHPSVYRGVVAWEDHRDGQAEIYAFDLERGAEAFRVTNDTAFQGNAAVGDGFILYEDRRDVRNGTDVWIYDLASGSHRPLVAKPGQQTDAVPVGDHVLFRDEEYGQYDMMAVRIAGDRPPFYVTRDIAIENAPTTTGNFGYFLSFSSNTWRLMGFDGIRNRTFFTGSELDTGARVEGQGSRFAFPIYHINQRYYVQAFDLETGRSSRIVTDAPIRGGPRWADDRLVAMLAPVQNTGTAGGLLVLEPSAYALARPPRLTMVGPPPEAPFMGPSFVANGTFRTTEAWGQPLRFEYRLGFGNWTAFDAAASSEWNVTVQVPRGAFRVGDRVPFVVRAVFAGGPPVDDQALLSFARVTTPTVVAGAPDESLFDVVRRALGAVVLVTVLLVVLALVVVRMILRGTFRRAVERRVQAEYVRPDDPR